MTRRAWLKAAAVTGGLIGSGAAAGWLWQHRPHIQVHRPGMMAGHRWRDQTLTHTAWRRQPADLQTEVLIIGSGAAALMCAWRLQREGHTRWLMLQGPEAGGNLAGGQTLGHRHPTGAHYLPLQSPESVHVRELLADLMVIETGAQDLRPRYDERALVHAPESRVWADGGWHDGLIPEDLLSDADDAAVQRFHTLIQTLQQARGEDGRRAFVVPLLESSTDPAWQAADQHSFGAWLRQHGFTAPPLLTYLDYCCRDEYGAGLEHVSAWAGLHYFAARRGQAANAQPGAVLSWPDGLAGIGRAMLRKADPAQQRLRPWMALAVDERPDGVRVLCASADGQAAGAGPIIIQARRIVLATPLPISLRLWPGLQTAGLDREALLPRSDWLICTAILDGFPKEALPRARASRQAWDNVVAGSAGLGWVVASHQEILVARPQQAALTSYRSYAPQTRRVWLREAEPWALAAEGLEDLLTVYGSRILAQLRALQITVRGHAMSVPTPGFLRHQGSALGRSLDQQVLLAHSDLSGLSVFEEATWWGDLAARRLLA